MCSMRLKHIYIFAIVQIVLYAFSLKVPSGWWGGTMVLSALALAASAHLHGTAERPTPTLSDCLSTVNPDALLVLREGRFVYANPAAVNMVGAQNLEQIYDVDPAQLSPDVQPCGERSEDAVRRHNSDATVQGFTRFRFWHRKFDGSIFPVQVTLVPTSYMGEQFLAVYWQDISEILRLEEENRVGFERVASRFEATVQSVTSVMKETSQRVGQTAETMARTADYACSQSEEVTSATNNASSGVQTVASAAEELSTASQEIMRQVVQSGELTKAAAIEAQLANDAVTGLAN